MHFPSRRSDKIKQQTFFFPLTLNNKALTWISEFHPKCLVTDKNEEIKMNLVCYNFLQWDYTTSKSTGVNPSHSELCFHAFSFYMLSKDRPTIFFWLSYFMKDLGQQSSSQNEIYLKSINNVMCLRMHGQFAFIMIMFSRVPEKTWH